MGKTLLVVGASSDLGTASIREIGSDYDCIIAHYRHMNVNLNALKETFKEKLFYLQADLSSEEETTKLIENIKRLGKIPTHILHFPAPPCNNQRFHKIPWETFQTELVISLRSAVLVAQAFLPEMARAHTGKLIFMLSFVVNGMPPKYCSNYVVDKYALLGLVKALAVEYADKGITVNGILPAWVTTKYLNSQPELLIRQNAERSPIGRNLTADDIVPTIRFLLSEQADCINGQNISITCGR